MAFQDPDLVAQHQQLGLISGAVAEGCESEVDEEPEAGVKDEQEHGRRLIVAGLGGAPLSADGLSAPHTLFSARWPAAVDMRTRIGWQIHPLIFKARARAAGCGQPALVSLDGE
jgi:hypothetical protein